MNKIQEPNKNINHATFVGAVGKGPLRHTRYGASIDVVRTDGPERVWGDLIPTNQEIQDDLRCGACIEVTNLETIQNKYRPLWRGKVRLIEH